MNEPEERNILPGDLNRWKEERYETVGEVGRGRNQAIQKMNELK